MEEYFLPQPPPVVQCDVRQVPGQCHSENLGFGSSDRSLAPSTPQVFGKTTLSKSPLHRPNNKFTCPCICRNSTFFSPINLQVRGLAHSTLGLLYNEMIALCLSSSESMRLGVNVRGSICCLFSRAACVKSWAASLGLVA